MAKQRSLDPRILDAVLEGLKLQKQQMDRYITEAERLLGGKRRKPAVAVKQAKQPRRKMSAAGRKRIAAAARRRWAEYRKAQSSKKA